MEHVEYEERVLISENDYKKVIDDVTKQNRPITNCVIENIYLDNNNFFVYHNKMMLRIRHTNGENEELTLKIRNQDGSNREINETLNHHLIIDKELDGKLEDYKPVTKLITERMEAKYDNYLLVIDKNYYDDIIDYDLEIEASSQEIALSIIKDYCKQYDLIYKDNYQTKSHRAISRLKNKMK